MAKKTITVYDIVNTMRDDGLLCDNIAFNELAGMPYVRGELPWDVSRNERQWEDSDLSNLYAYLQETAHIGRSKSEVIEALNVFLSINRYHPVREWLEGLPEWDGKERVSTLLHDFLGAETSQYTANVTWLMMYGAIARAVHPGCKFDLMIVLQGRQGLMKSSFVARLTPKKEWLLEGIPDMTRNKDFAEQLRGKWICEVAELDGMSGKDVNAVKAAITKLTDTYRAPYARYTRDHPRQCVFIGTANDGAFLTDLTGNRRFVIVECGKQCPRLNLMEMPRGYMLQVWAEAWDRWNRQDDRPQLYLSAAMEREAEAVRETFMSGGDDVSKVRDWLLTRRNQPVCAAMVAEQCFGVSRTNAAYDRTHRMVVKILDNQCPGWERHRSKSHKLRIRDYGIVLAWSYHGDEANGS